MAVELLSLSKFKLQLLALVSEARDLREREHSCREELHLSTQRQKQTEAEYGRKLQELQTELASRDESQLKLENKIKYLENENVLLEKKQKELKETIDSLLQSRETFVSLYEDSTCTLRRSTEIRDRKLAVLSEKLHAHLVLFDSIGKEATAVKQVVDSIQQLVNEKEQVVTGLKGKMDKIAALERDFIEKIHFLENKLGHYKHELRRRDTTISELKEHLEAEKIRSNLQPQVEELRKVLLVKEEIIQNLTSEKQVQVLHLELQNLEVILRKIQDTVVNMSAEDQKVFSSGLEGQEECQTISKEENESAAVPLHQEYKLANDSCCDKQVLNSCLSEPLDYSSPLSVCSDPPSTVNIPRVSIDGSKSNCISLVPHRIDSESSTTEAEASKAAPE